MTDQRKHPCPNCGRPVGFEYIEVAAGKCQLWRWFLYCNDTNKIPPRTVADCFRYATHRIIELEAKVADQADQLKAAQRSLSRHHEAVHARDRVSGLVPAADMFPDDARIE